MIIILILLGVIGAIFSYLLFAPFYLEVDSTKGFLRLRFHRLASADLRIVDFYPILELRVFGWKKKMDLLKTMKTSKEKSSKRKKIENKKGKKSSWMKVTLKKIVGVLKSFKINKCELLIDSGNVQLNGILYPIFYLAGYYYNKNISINFVNKNVIILEIENSVARMSRAYISS